MDGETSHGGRAIARRLAPWWEAALEYDKGSCRFDVGAGLSVAASALYVPTLSSLTCLRVAGGDRG
jgi:hypothetical protein